MRACWLRSIPAKHYRLTEDRCVLDDIEAIKRIQAQYGRAADTKDWPLLRPTVTDDFFVTLARAAGA
jgi:hypothetical protein